MSEELSRDHLGSGEPIEPPLSSETVGPGLTSSSKRPVPGGGSKLSSSDQPGDPYATLIVLPIDGLMGSKVYSAPRPLPQAVEDALTAAVRIAGESARCVVVVSGGAIMPQACMQALVQRMPGGLDSFGRGRKIEALVKESSADFGDLWEGALLVKGVAKRQAALVRFGAIAVVTGTAMAPATERVYRKCFDDWRVLESGGLGRGGRDLPVPIRVTPIDVLRNEGLSALQARAAGFDDASFARAMHTYSRHPSWPRCRTPPPDGASEASDAGTNGACGNGPLAKRRKED